MEQVAVFGGGCFWCTEPVFSQLKGVNRVVSGYIGGQVVNPTYKQVCTGETGHAEAIQIHFDADLVSFETLLNIFFVSHDPTTPNRQGNDIGTQYRSSVFCQNPEQRAIVTATIAQFNADLVFGAPVVTEVHDAEVFYAAEDYHQYYFANNPYQPYCMAVAAPKVMKIRAKYAHLLKAGV
jgi:peptide-methionine (S)-S-oxide reductase